MEPQPARDDGSVSMSDPSPQSAPMQDLQQQQQQQQGTAVANKPKPKARPPPRGTAFYQRRRAVKACQVCRARRTKCDNLKPSCSFCLKVGAKCIQSPVDLSSFDPASLKILERLDDLEELVRAGSSAHGSPDEPFHKTRVVEAGGGRPMPGSRSPEPSHNVSPPLETAMILPLSLDAILEWPCFAAPAARAHHALGVSPGRSPAHIGGRVPPGSVLRDADLEPARVRSLLDSFFSFVHVKNPIFDEGPTRRVVESAVRNGIDWSPESCLALLICALGSIATPFGPSYESMPGKPAYDRALSFFHAAQERIGALLCSDDVRAPQCFFLSGVFMMCVFQPTKAWRYFIQALVHCQQLNFLSQGPSLEEGGGGGSGAHEAGTDDIDSRHQAVYWSSWKSERELRSAMRMPDFRPNDLGVNLYPFFFPTPPPPRPADASEMSAGQLREQTSWYFYLAEISLRRMAGRIGNEIETMQKTHPTRLAFLHAAAAATPGYEAQAREWISSLPPSLCFDAPPDEDDVCRFVLRGHSINLFEMIYWPFLAAHLDHLAPDASDLVPFTALAQRALDNHALRLTVNEPGYTHRHHGTYPMMQSCSRSALVLVAASLHNRASPRDGSHHGCGCSLVLPANWNRNVSEVIRLHEQWSSELHELYKLGETRRVLEWGLYGVMS